MGTCGCRIFFCPKKRRRRREIVEKVGRNFKTVGLPPLPAVSRRFDWWFETLYMSQGIYFVLAGFAVAF
jgi:hypothetical protein